MIPKEKQKRKRGVDENNDRVSLQKKVYRFLVVVVDVLSQSWDKDKICDYSAAYWILKRVLQSA